ncbi:hypothetical protein Pla123a_45890 [Posidoniimonas polymericola]|uniref:PEP-CTERM protein-sorting domain-containing protein n=1 Tax=Posidoniimonas polymericola TaxID=2528002 RepID=A0A5C5XW12_9BACT|nr:hypothetical protein [Posidoniimonas polymericola]TWT66888.1 hypothetical protein Pla123a_45890 [Posidoniimonas polymericola]
MTSIWRLLQRLTITCLVGATFAAGSSALAVVSLTADPAFPDFPSIFTVNPLAGTTASRNVAADRMLRQTFKNPATFDVGQIIVGLDVQDANGGLVLNLYEVDDVNASPWSPGALVTTFSFPTTIDTDERIGVSLTAGDIFELPARFEGTTGYGLEISNFDATTNIGALVHTLNTGDLYADGAFYTESGGFSGSGDRDIAVAFASATAGPSTPGDVDGDGDVDAFELDGDMISDLDIIAANFRSTGAVRTTGDLTGDGRVDLFDFREWKSNFPGAVTPAMLASLGIPEPTSLATALVAVAAIGARRGRREGTA